MYATRDHRFAPHLVLAGLVSMALSAAAAELPIPWRMMGVAVVALELAALFTAAFHRRWFAEGPIGAALVSASLLSAALLLALLRV